jgi:hypothetical protein
MLPPEILDLLQQWWKARPTWHDIGVQRWSFPGRNRHQPLTTRQFGRLLATWREKAQQVRPLSAGGGLLKNCLSCVGSYPGEPLA